MMMMMITKVMVAVREALFSVVSEQCREMSVAESKANIVFREQYPFLV